MSSPTRLQEVYDSFISKLDEDLTGKEEFIFNFLRTAISKSYKTVRHLLDYVLDTPTTDNDGNIINTFDGSFVNTLDQDEIELLSLYMVYENKRRRKEYLESLKREIGTKDFNKLSDKAHEFSSLGVSMRDLMEEIKDLKNEFYTYKYI